MKKGLLFSIFMLFVAGLFFYIGKKSHSLPLLVKEKHVDGILLQSNGTRSFASDNAATDEVILLNNIIYSVKSYEDILPKSLELEVATASLMESVSETSNQYPVYAMYNSLAKVIPLLEGILWRLGGLAIKSEYIYYAFIGGLTDIAYNNFMYSKPVDHFLEFLVRPKKDMERFSNVSEVQDLVITKIIPLLEESLIPKFEKILTQFPGWKDFEFQYDRALSSGGVDFTSPETISASFSSEGDRYATFTRAYLASAMGYTKNILAGMYLFCAYNLDDINSLLNRAFYEAITKTKLKGLFTDWLSSKDSNIKLNTHKDYAQFIKKYPKLFTLLENKKWSDGSVSNGQFYREKALQYFQEANDHDLDYIKQIHEQAQMPNQDMYIINAEQMIVNQKYSIAHYENMEKILKGKHIIVDSATGKSVLFDFTKLFDKSFNKDLKAYFPTQFDFEKRNNFLWQVEGKDTFIYTYGRPNAWPDPSFNGLLPEAKNENLRELYRRLMYNNDVDYFAGIIFSLVL